MASHRALYPNVSVVLDGVGLIANYKLDGLPRLDEQIIINDNDIRDGAYRVTGVVHHLNRPPRWTLVVLGIPDGGAIK